MAIVYLGLGSNLGKRRENIDSAINLLKENKISVLRCSSITETAPVDCPPNQRNFLNGVLKIETDLLPHELLGVLKTIERQIGRKEAVRNGPRPIDLDILLYNQIKIQTPDLTIPHPRMFERDFVMIPLREIEPHLNEERWHAHN